MVWQDRDYNRHDGHVAGPPVGFGPRIGRRSVVFWLLLINIGVFILNGILTRLMDAMPGDGLLFRVGYFSADTAIYKFQIWRFLSFQFLHADLAHLFGNMLGIFFFGPLIESFLGSRRFLRFYLLCGFAGSLGYLLLWSTGLIVSHVSVPLVGASAGVFGILIAAALVAPNVNVLLFFVLPIRLRMLVWIIVGVAAYIVLAEGHVPGSNAGGQSAHLGGAGIGFLLIKNPSILNRLDLTRWRSSSNKGRGRWYRRQEAIQQDNTEVDRILSKVKEHGLHSLTRREKRTLQRATERQRSTG